MTTSQATTPEAMSPGVVTEYALMLTAPPGSRPAQPSSAGRMTLPETPGQ